MLCFDLVYCTGDVLSRGLRFYGRITSRVLGTYNVAVYTVQYV